MRFIYPENQYLSGVILAVVELNHDYSTGHLPGGHMENSVLADLAFFEDMMPLVHQHFGPFLLPLKDVSLVAPRKDLDDPRLLARWKYLLEHSQYLKQSRSRRVIDGPEVIRKWYTHRLMETYFEMHDRASLTVKTASSARDRCVNIYAGLFGQFPFYICDQLLEKWTRELDPDWEPCEPQPDWWPSHIPYIRIRSLTKSSNENQEISQKREY
jgi:hypothetical protein